MLVCTYTVDILVPIFAKRRGNISLLLSDLHPVQVPITMSGAQSSGSAAIEQAQELMVVNTPTKRKSSTGKEQIVYAPMSPYNRIAFEWITNFLKTHQNQILLCKSKLELGECNPTVNQDKKMAAKESPFFNATYQLFDRLPLYYIADLFVNTFGLDRDIVNKVEAHQSKNLRNALEYLCGIPAHLRWVPDLKRKAVLVLFLADMYKVLGKRGPQFEQAVSAGGEVNWPKLCPYKFTYIEREDEDFVNTISYNGMVDCKTTAKVTKVNILKACDATQHWSDRDAKFVDETDWSQNMMALFPSDAAFKDVLTFPKMMARASEHKTSWDAADKLSKVGVNTDILTLSKRKRVEKMQAAKTLTTPLKKMKAPMIIE
jgi:hypothetical protein